MSKKKLAARVIVLIIAILANIGIIGMDTPAKTVQVDVTVKSDVETDFQLFYAQLDSAAGFTIDDSSVQRYEAVGKSDVLTYRISSDATMLRLDFADVKNNSYVEKVVIRSGKTEREITTEQLCNLMSVNQADAKFENGRINVKSNSEDPFITWDASDWGISDVAHEGVFVKNTVLKILACLIIDLMVVYALINVKKIAMLPIELFQNRKLVFNLAKNDFKTQFAGSYLGIVWAFVQPIVTVLVYWFVFEKGLKAGGINTRAGIQVPFVLWLIAGIVPWFFFQDALNGGTNALVQYSYLVKKVVFKISILPIVKVISALFVHLFFIAFTLILYSCYHYYPDLYTLQIFYYTLCMIIFVLGLVYITCAIVVFFKDLTQIINIVLQIGIWMTPIMWNIDAMDLNPILITIFKLNPMYYIVAGYRDALINKVWFWQNMPLTIYFWIITAILFGLGSFVFRRLKVHFADVL